VKIGKSFVFPAFLVFGDDSKHFLFIRVFRTKVKKKKKTPVWTSVKFTKYKFNSAKLYWVCYNGEINNSDIKKNEKERRDQHPRADNIK
jgi:hypothetical protein